MEATESQTTEPAWAVIELMGHVRYGGRVSKDNQFGTAMLRVDVPQKDGSFVTQLVNPQSLYRLTICSEEIARAAANAGSAEPMQPWQLRHLLPAPSAETTGEYSDDEDNEDDEDDRES